MAFGGHQTARCLISTVLRTDARVVWLAEVVTGNVRVDAVDDRRVDGAIKPHGDLETVARFWRARQDVAVAAGDDEVEGQSGLVLWAHGQAEVRDLLRGRAVAPERALDRGVAWRVGTAVVRPKSRTAFEEDVDAGAPLRAIAVFSTLGRVVAGHHLHSKISIPVHGALLIHERRRVPHWVRGVCGRLVEGWACQEGRGGIGLGQGPMSDCSSAPFRHGSWMSDVPSGLWDASRPCPAPSQTIGT